MGNDTDGACRRGHEGLVAERPLFNIRLSSSRHGRRAGRSLYGVQALLRWRRGGFQPGQLSVRRRVSSDIAGARGPRMPNRRCHGRHAITAGKAPIGARLSAGTPHEETTVLSEPPSAPLTRPLTASRLRCLPTSTSRQGTVDGTAGRRRLTDDQRRRLAANGRRCGRRILRQVATIVTPAMILR